MNRLIAQHANKKRIISVIGAGGKTTLLHQLAEGYRRKGLRVLVTTTTHMLIEADTDLSCDSFVIGHKLETDGYCMAGARCEESKKICALPHQVLGDLYAVADIVLIEADGAKHHSLKYPAAHEPVIVPETTEVILLMGLWELGKPAETVVYRYAESGVRLAGSVQRQTKHGTQFTGSLQQRMEHDAQARVSLSWIQHEIYPRYHLALQAQGYHGAVTYLLSEKSADGLVFLTWQEAVAKYGLE